MSRAHDEREEQRSFELVRGALNATNRAKWDVLEIEIKRWLVDQAFNDGILTYDPPGRRIQEALDNGTR